jgi:lysozyme
MSRAAAAIVIIAAGAGVAYWWSTRPRDSGAAAVTGLSIADDYLSLWFANPYTDTSAVESTTTPVDPDGYVDEGFVENNFMPVVYKAGAVLSGITGGRMQLSIAGLNAIKTHEAFAAVPYKDQAGIWTIGYGHKIIAGEQFVSLTEGAASALLAQDVSYAEDAVNASVRIGLTQGQFDALVSFVFNVGTGAFRRSTMLRKLNAGDPSVVNEFTRWVYVTKGGQKVQSAGLMNRRQAELAMFNGGSFYG